jgi:RNA polymerase sigma-70 factor (ECF subfamily)
MPSSYDEPALLTHCHAGDRTARERLVRRQLEPTRRYFARRVPCPADVDDLVQRTLMASVRALPRFRGTAAFSRFVRAIAAKELLYHWREDGRARRRLDTRTQPDTVCCQQPSALARISREDDLHGVRRVLDTLPEAPAQILRMRYWDDLDFTEISQQLGISPGLVRVRLHRARHQLRRALDAAIGDGAAAGPDLWPLEDL